VSALSASVDTAGSYPWIYLGQRHWMLSGTSMAAPHVTGAAALLLGANPMLSAAEIKAALQTTANIDPFTADVPNYVWGSGKLDVLEAMAQLLTPGAQLFRTTVAYDSPGSNGTRPITGALKVGVQFTAPANGTLTGVLLNVTTDNNRPIVGSGNLVLELFAGNGSAPGAQLGTTCLSPLAMLNPGTLNYIQCADNGAMLTAGTDYVAVLSVSNPGDSLIIRTDMATTGSRSTVYNGTSWLSAPRNHRLRMIVTSSTRPTDVAAEQAQPVRFSLDQNYPNPFNPATRISYAVHRKSMVRLTVYDLLGKEVARLVEQEQPGGSHQVEWNGRNTVGMQVASGVYFYRLESAGMAQTRKMMFMK